MRSTLLFRHRDFVTGAEILPAGQYDVCIRDPGAIDFYTDSAQDRSSTFLGINYIELCAYNTDPGTGCNTDEYWSTQNGACETCLTG